MLEMTAEMRRFIRQKDLQGTVHTLMCDPIIIPRVAKIVPKPKNFCRINKSNISRLEADHALHKEQSIVPPKSLWMSSKYTSVPCRVFDNVQSSCSKASSTQRHINFSDDSYKGPQSELSSSLSSRSSISRSISKPGPPKDFIKLNSKAAKHTKVAEPKKSHFEKLNELPKAETGKVPHYLLKRQDEWEKEKAKEEEIRRKNELPKGCQLMEESERTAILDELRKERMEKEQELMRLPIRSDTLRAKINREEIEKELTKIEDQIEILSKPKVYVPIDACGDYNRSSAN